MRKAVWLASIACASFAADPAVEGPMIGYVNSAAGVRRVLGVTGSARLSAPLTGELHGALVLAGRGAAVAKNPAGALVRIDFKDGSLLSLGVENVADFVVSPSGGAVAASTAGRLHLLSASGEPKGDYVAPGAVRLMAVSDDAAAVVVSVGGAGGEAVHVVDAHGSRQVFQADRIAAVAFVPGGRDSVFADGEGAIYRITGDLQFAQIGTAPGTVALAATADGRVLAVARKTIVTLRSDAAPSTSADLVCEATTAKPLGHSRFLLTSGEDGPMWMVDASAADLRLAFIPEAVNEIE
ncbi:MAG TPA: hypothetical protein VER03_08935 [Bryobacteraceae bacterium]|nr:hypothetical protein [Bryobacteraceae bacterium]